MSFYIDASIGFSVHFIFTSNTKIILNELFLIFLIIKINNNNNNKNLAYFDSLRSTEY